MGWRSKDHNLCEEQNITQCLVNKTQAEMFMSDNPKVSHPKMLCFHVYIHVPKEKRSKLDPSCNKGIFFGYSDPSKDYQVYIQGYC